MSKKKKASTGFMLVPITPSWEMIVAGANGRNIRDRGAVENIEYEWECMLAAIPAAREISASERKLMDMVLNIVGGKNEDIPE